MKKRVQFREPATDVTQLGPLPDSSNYLAEDNFPGASVLSWQAHPWPLSLTPQPMGNLPPYDVEFAERVRAPGVTPGWQQSELDKNPWWGHNEVILQAKQMEFTLFAQSAQSRRHEIAMHQDARIRPRQQIPNVMPQPPTY